MHFYPMAYSFIRANLTVGLLVGSAVTIAYVPTAYLTLAVLCWAGVAGLIMLVAHQKTRAVARKFKGPILEFVFAPTPMGSVFGSLAKHGVPPDQIKSIALMSGNIKESLRYFESGAGDGSFFQVLDACPDMHATVYGFSDDPEMQSGHPRVDLIVTRDRFNEHTNLITAKSGKSFVWYEPCHVVSNGNHYFTRGAYLISIDEAMKATIEADFSALVRQPRRARAGAQ
jgi:hypothetical protein